MQEAQDNWVVFLTGSETNQRWAKSIEQFPRTFDSRHKAARFVALMTRRSIKCSLVTEEVYKRDLEALEYEAEFLETLIAGR